MEGIKPVGPAGIPQSVCAWGKANTTFQREPFEGRALQRREPQTQRPGTGQGDGAQGGGPRGDTVGCGQKGLLVTEPFSSACEMLVVTELRPTKRSFYSTRWRGEKKNNKKPTNHTAEVKIFFLIPLPGFSFFPAFFLCLPDPPSLFPPPFCFSFSPLS